MMKRILWLTLAALGISLVVNAQNVNDDLYFVPSKKKEAKAQNKTEVKIKDKNAVPSEIVVRSAEPVSDNVREEETYMTDNEPVTVPTDDVDAYNRRSSSSVATAQTTRRSTAVDEGLDGEWVNGFNGTVSDYEYATRIIRFRNPRFAISISSPLYWDVVYGLTAWDWNVYVDDFYAYAFPTFSNRLWWDWHWGGIGLGWHSWGWPYYGMNWAYGWAGWHAPYYSWGWRPGWGWYGGFYAGGYYPPYGGPIGHWGWGSAPRYAYNDRRGGGSISTVGRDLFGRSTRTVTTNGRVDANGRSGGRVVSNSGNTPQVTGSTANSRIARRAENGTGVTTTRQTTTTRNSGTTVNGSTGVKRTYGTASERVSNRSSVGTSSRTTTTNSTRSTTVNRNSSSVTRSISTGGGFGSGSTTSGASRSGGSVSSGSSGGARRR